MQSPVRWRGARRASKVAAACLILAAAAGCAPGGAGPADDEARALAAPVDTVPAAAEEEIMIRIEDLVIAGRGSAAAVAAASAAAPNRVGSARIPVRSYAPAGEPWATLVWAHGGSFVRGTLDWPEADWVSRAFAEAGIRVYSVDYALAGDAVRAPAPANDVAAVLAWAAAETDGPLVIGGASAGGHLATLAALDLANAAGADPGSRTADALILEYPTLHRVQRADAAIAAATAELPEARRFDAERIAAMYADHLGAAGDAEVADGGLVAGELPAARLALLPPTVIVNADADDLRASAEEFAEQLRAAGVPVVEHVQPGTVHGYLNRPEESDAARADAAETIATFVAGLREILEPSA